MKKLYYVLLIITLIVLQSCENQDLEWVFIDPIQCSGNPWEQSWLEENNNDYDLWSELSEEERLNVFEFYYEKQGIIIHNIRVSHPYEFTCAACGCVRGDRIHVLVDDYNTQQMLDLGFELE